jgi:hypothetical protein
MLDAVAIDRNDLRGAPGKRGFKLSFSILLTLR